MSTGISSGWSTRAPWLAGAAFLSAGLFSCLVEKVAPGSVLCTVGLLLWLIANLNRLQSFKGFGLEVLTRDLEHATDVAKRTLADLEAVQAKVADMGQAMEAQKVAADEAREKLAGTLAAIKAELESASGMATIAYLQSGGTTIR